MPLTDAERFAVLKSLTLDEPARKPHGITEWYVLVAERVCDAYAAREAPAPSPEAADSQALVLLAFIKQADAANLATLIGALRERFRPEPGAIKSPIYLTAAALAELLARDSAPHGS